MSWILLTADVTEELALGQKLLKAAPQSLLDLLIRVVFCIVAFLIGSRIISFIRKLTGNALKRANASKEAKQFLDSSLKVGLYAFLIFQIAVKLGIDATTIATVIGSATVTIGLAFQGIPSGLGITSLRIIIKMKVRFLKSLFFTQSWQPLTIKLSYCPMARWPIPALPM